MKIRGFRIELGEIEAALPRRPCPVMDASGGASREDGEEERRLVAYVVSDADRDTLRRRLRERLRETLPDYMVPSAFVFLGALPLTPNGKVDKAALPAPDAGARGTRPVPPRTVQEVVAAVWNDVLGLPSVGAHDNFFDLGGHSLLAARLMARLRATSRSTCRCVICSNGQRQKASLPQSMP